MITNKFIALTLFAALALAPASVLRAQGNPDSGKCPWPLPFSITFSASFEQNTLQEFLNQDHQLETILEDTTEVAEESDGVNVYADSYSLMGDTLNYYFDEFYFGMYHLSIIFVPGFDSIASLTYSFDTTFNGNMSGFDHEYSFSLFGLRYDSISIICPDSSLSHAAFTKSYDDGSVLAINGGGILQSHSTSVGLLSMTLGGIVRPITLSIPAAVSMPTRNSNVSLQSYPNPFSQSTTISFTPESSGYADVSIVNLLGTEVAHLFSGELAAGEHSFVWSNPTGLPDGTYECLIRFNGQVQTMPMVLMR
jgi:hypothetical protein